MSTKSKKLDELTDSMLNVLLGFVLGALTLAAGAAWFNRGCNPSYDIVTIDGCQYIGTRWSSHRTLVHKANCPNHKK